MRSNSVLIDVCNGPLNEVTTVDAAKIISRQAINDCAHNANKRKMLYDLETCQTLESVQQFMFNAMLKFQGHQVIK